VQRFGAASLIALCLAAPAPGQFRVVPYLQLVETDSVTIVWWSPDGVPGIVDWGPTPFYGQQRSSVPLEMSAITTVIAGVEDRGRHPYRHEVRLDGLSPNTAYFYRVSQGASEKSAQFRTAPGLESGFTFVVAADPESKATEPIRNEIHRAVLSLASTKDPRFLVYAGDLVDQGNAQDDWDSFWSDLTELGPSVPIYPALGNHEYDALNTTLGGNTTPYSQPFAEDGVARYRAYFALPGNDHEESDPRHERYYWMKYGPVSVIVLDTNNDSITTSDPGTNWDTGRYSAHPLAGENEPPEPGGQSWAPDVHGGVGGVSDSAQYAWLVETLPRARRESAFVFVVNHQAPYSSFVHGEPSEQQSGHPLRKLDSLFHRHGVDAVFSGHDESSERSVTTGTRAGAPGEIHYFLVTTIGDPTGLRLPASDPWWQEGFSRFLYPLEKRRHGYLAVEIEHLGGADYRATLTPYYYEPSDPANANLFYDDVVVLEGRIVPQVAISGPAELCEGAGATYEASPGFASYAWLLDAAPIGSGPSVDVGGLSPGAHTLEVEASGPGSITATSFLTIDVASALTHVSIAVSGSTAACATCLGGTASVIHAGGGAATEAWGYRVASGGAVTPIPGETGDTYVIHGADFAGLGTYLLVATTTPACGDPITSNEIPVSVVVPGDVKFVTVTSYPGRNVISWINPDETTFVETRVVARAGAPPTNPDDPLAVFEGNESGLPGQAGSVEHAGLFGGTDYYYAAFAHHGPGTYALGRTIHGPALEVAALWRSSLGALALSPPGIGTGVYVVANDSTVRAVARGCGWRRAAPELASDRNGPPGAAPAARPRLPE
jgi:hypothetical protein